jgi:hypothetical protein
MYPPFWWRHHSIPDDCPNLHEKWKQPFWWQEYGIADDDPRLQDPWKQPLWWREHGISDNDPRLAHNRKQLAAKEKRPASTSSRDPTTKPSRAAGGKRKRPIGPKDDAEAKYNEQASRGVVKRRRRQGHGRGREEATTAVLTWLGNKPDGGSTVGGIKRQREPEDDGHNRRDGMRRARATASAARASSLPNNTTLSGRARAQVSAAGREAYSDRPATNHHVSLAKPPPPPLSSSSGNAYGAPSNNTPATRQPKSKTPTSTLSMSKKPPRDVDEAYAPVGSKRRNMANPIQRLSSTMATPLSPISSRHK